MEYKKWPNEELYGDILLQYDASTSNEEILSIPFQLVEWLSHESNSEQWNEENTKISMILEGNIVFDGIRHCTFSKPHGGYLHYPNMYHLSLCLNRLHQLCNKYSREYSSDNIEGI